jgi:hypothetical protein
VITSRVALCATCLGRERGLYSLPDLDTAYIRQYLGDIPLIGFSPAARLRRFRRNTLHQYSGVLVLIGKERALKRPPPRPKAFSSFALIPNSWTRLVVTLAEAGDLRPAGFLLRQQPFLTITEPGAAQILFPCRAVDGKVRRERFEFNPRRLCISGQTTHLIKTTRRLIFAAFNRSRRKKIRTGSSKEQHTQ